jgi:hypothetical protein
MVHLHYLTVVKISGGNVFGGAEQNIILIAGYMLKIDMKSVFIYVNKFLVFFLGNHPLLEKMIKKCFEVAGCEPAGTATGGCEKAGLPYKPYLFIR